MEVHAEPLLRTRILSMRRLRHSLLRSSGYGATIAVCRRIVFEGSQPGRGPPGDGRAGATPCPPGGHWTTPAAVDLLLPCKETNCNRIAGTGYQEDRGTFR
jgi:hypothetical protein